MMKINSILYILILLIISSIIFFYGKTEIAEKNLIKIEKKLETAEKKLETDEKKLETTEKDLEIVKDVRCIGAIGVVELRDDTKAQIVQDFCVKNGVWIRPFGKLVYSIVSYNITDTELYKITSTVKEAIKNL